MTDLKKYYLYFTIFITGASVLVIEILGTRVLAPFYGSTIFVWTSLITVTLGALALGYWFGGNLADKKHSFVNFYATVSMAGISVAIFLQYKKFIILFSDMFGLQYGPLVASILLFGVPLFFLGMMTPYAIRLSATVVEASGKTAGRIFSFATVGSIVGALVSGFFLIPLLPISSIFYIVALLLILLGLSGIALAEGWNELFSRQTLAVIIISVILFLVGYFLKTSDFPEMTLQDHGVYDTGEVLLEKDTLYANYRLMGIPKGVDGTMCLLTDSAHQGCVYPHLQKPAPSYVFINAIQEELYTKEPKILMLGAGLGMLLYYGAPENTYYDILDINPYTEKIFEIVGTKLRPNRDNVIIDEARSYLIKTEKKYDLIWDNLWGSAGPISHMMTKEAYELVKERLNPGGIYLTYAVGSIDEYNNDILMGSTVSTLQSVFENVLITKGREGDDAAFIIATDAPLSKNRLNAVISEAFRESPYTENTRKIYMDILALTEPKMSGRIITDNWNLTEHLWADFVKGYENIANFRLDFNRLTKNDFIY